MIFLVFGGLITTYLALNTLSDGEGFMVGLNIVYETVPERFAMILDKSNPEFNNLPGIGVLVGGMWVANLYYWGFNQYIIQRTLAAKSLKEAQKGILFAAFLKLIIPLIVVIPGIAAYVMINDPEIMARLGDVALTNIPSLEQADKAYPWLLQFLPVGLKGVAFAALAAAIVSSLASMLNSTSTIFTMDIYKQIKNNVDDNKLVTIGRVAGLTSMVIAIIIAKPLLGNFSQAFQFIQEFTGFFTPGIVVIFLLGLFWKKATTMSVLIAAGTSLFLSIFIWYVFPEYPFIHRMGVVFLISGLTCYMTALIQGYTDQEKAIDISGINFRTEKSFNISTVIICIILIITYSLLW